MQKIPVVSFIVLKKIVSFIMALLERKVFIILMCIIYSWPEDIHSIHTEEPLTNTMCSNDTENGHCETVTTDTNTENSTDINTSSTPEENANSTASLEIEEGQNVSTEVSGTTTVPPSSVTPTVPTTSTERTTTEPSYDMHFIPEEICSCDMTIDYCDINCCCDEDCSASDRQAFSHCFQRPSTAADPRYCYQTNFVYRNNTEYKMVQNKEGLFCILWDNLPSETRYLKRKVVTKLKDFKKLFEGRKIYQWKLDVTEEPVFQSVMYRAGSIVWTISNTTLSPLVLPNKQITAFCDISMPIQYLIDWTGSCSSVDLTCTSKSGLSGPSYYETFFVIATPQLMNHTQIMYFLEQQECSYNICLPFSLFLCASDTVRIEDCDLVDEIEVPSYENETDVCSNVVKQVKYRLHHNGSLGIMKAEAYFWIVDLKPTQTNLKQTFSVEFVWIDAPEKVFRRSGNPGYIVGKPVIAGQKAFHVSKTEDEPDKEAILLSEEQSKWLTLPKPGVDGLCINSTAEGSRIPVNFGENLLSSCMILLSARNFSSQENCSFLQRKVLHILLGDIMINVTEPKQFNMYVSTFGDANVEETGDWAPVLLENMPILSVDWKEEGVSLVCKSVVTSMHVNVVTSKVGLATKPQTKILGVAITFGGGQDLVFDCSPSPCSRAGASKKQKFVIQSSVSFVDVSKPPVVHFAEPPVYEVKLPYDFFYPFLSSNGVRLVSCCYILSTTILLLWKMAIEL